MTENIEFLQRELNGACYEHVYSIGLLQRDVVGFAGRLSFPIWSDQGIAC